MPPESTLEREISLFMVAMAVSLWRARVAVGREQCTADSAVESRFPKSSVELPSTYSQGISSSCAIPLG